jgi:outer membrane biosynthesis protein TonB
VNDTNYLRTAWAVSIGLHVLLAAVFFLIVIPIKPFVEEFAEMYFQTIPAARQRQEVKSMQQPARQMPVVAPKENKEQTTPSQAKPGARVELPQRRLSTDDQAIQPIPEQVRRVEPSQQESQEVLRSVSVPPLEGAGKAIPSVQPGERETPDIDQLLTAGPRPEGPTIKSTPLAGTSQQPFEIEWKGPSREILSGPLPAYPPGVKKEVRIRLDFQVLPDGTVGMISPATKGETTLENVSMEALKNWRFNPLDSAQPQTPQSAVITFVFKLE